ncbi:MAG TPA: signal peptidase I [Candidatus Acidoferrales bacterium]|jgi:signal peptidase I|nr:signal peptidase I [Candidatus Acidoferrales bacterium]
MRRRKSIFSRLSVRAQWGFRVLGRWPKKSRKKLGRWWSIYQLRFSWGKFFGEVGSVICLLGLAGLSFLFVSHFVFESVQVLGPSMSPTLANSNFYWLDKFAYQFRDPRAGDIIAIRDPSGRGFDVKRVIGVPTESIYISHGRVYVDGKLLREPYLPARERTFAYDLESQDEYFCLSTNQFFVMGDNRGNSCDSRSFGPITRDSILGRVIQ